MPTKVILTVQKGNLSGKAFTFEGKESLIIGRQDDCSIVLPETTVSRYHCLIDIAPPDVVVRDFGSLNGTYLNGEKIGQREAGISAEEGRKSRGEEFSMKQGDTLGLGADCEIGLDVRLPQYCADCFSEMSDVMNRSRNPEGLPICADCGKRRDEEKKARKAIALEHREEEKKRLAKELEEQRKAEQARKAAELKRRNNRHCEICGKSLSEAEAPGICESCQKDPIKVLMFLMDKAQNGVGEAKEIKGFRNIKMLGQGGMGQVWLVEEEATGKQMALKLMLPKAAADENSREMFLREAHFAAQLNHKNIVRYYKCGQSGDAYFILLEFCESGSVDALIEKNGGRLSVDLATNIILQVLDGLIYAHKSTVSVALKNGKTATANGIVHRDFKPANIFLTGAGKNLTAKAADFGLAKAFETSGLSGNTRTGSLAGTPVYMPRQQIINFKYSKPAVDCWAAAASYYFMLTGNFVKDFAAGRDVIAAALSQSAVPIRKRNAVIPKKLAEVIDHALIEKPDIGVQSAAELKRLIEGAL